MKSITQSLTKLSILTGILAAVFAANYLFAWTAPTANPPGANVAAPVNVGNSDQWKTASLGVNGLAVNGNSTNDGSFMEYIFHNGHDGFVPTTWRLRRNDGTGNFLLYMNTLGGLGATFDTEGYAFKEIYNPGDGDYRFHTSGVLGTAGNVISWVRSLTLTGAGDVIIHNNLCDDDGNCADVGDIIDGVDGTGGDDGAVGMVGDILMAAVTTDSPMAEIGYGDEIEGRFLCPAGLHLTDTDDNNKAGYTQATGNSCDVNLTGKYVAIGAALRSSNIAPIVGESDITLFRKISDTVEPYYIWRAANWSACSAPEPGPSCGDTTYGTQNRAVTCREYPDDTMVPPSNCTEPEPASTQSCARSNYLNCGP